MVDVIPDVLCKNVYIQPIFSMLKHPISADIASLCLEFLTVIVENNDEITNDYKQFVYSFLQDLLNTITRVVQESDPEDIALKENEYFLEYIVYIHMCIL